MAQEILLPTLPSLLATRGTPLIHRDLSWLQFNERVLYEARNINNPLLERLKFLGITASNLDEFFMIRCASLNRRIDRERRNPDPHAKKHLLRIRANLLESVSRFLGAQTEALELLSSELSKHNVIVVNRSSEGDEGFEVGRAFFSENILPKLSAPEPFSYGLLSGLENLQMAVIFGHSFVFKIPKSIPGAFVVNRADQQRSFVFFLDDLLLAHMGSAFRLNGLPGILRLTRDGDLGVDLEEEDPETIPEFVRSKLGSRERGRSIRLQWAGDLTDQFLKRCVGLFRISAHQVFSSPGPISLSGVTGILGQVENVPLNLRYPPVTAPIPRKFKKSPDFFQTLSRQDVLLHHPYDSFDSFVNLIRSACVDPQVTMIEQTVYRIDAASAILQELKKAAKTKKVRVMIELRARFDEFNNLQIAEELRRAGAEVAFGFGKLKLHAKIALVTRKEKEGTRLYTHLSTGNYNSNTARQYTDLAILTSNPEIGADARQFFDSVWEQRVPSNFKQLISAPLRLHRKLLNLIESETKAALAGRKARVFAKVNALVDESVTQALYSASRAGVQVDLVVRGACSLVPGIKGLSENIRVISIVDRFLEHSRIYYFEDSKTMYLSSADWMPRNFFSRLELAFPVLDERIYKYIRETLIPIYLLDTLKASELTAQGIWKRRTRSSIKKSDFWPEFIKDKKESQNAQALLQMLAEKEYAETALGKMAIK